MTHRMKFLAGALALSGGLAASQAAQASPQVLGLQASLRPTVMQCTAAGCRADLSAFCLEQHRPDPRVGTVYHPAPNAPITVVVISRSGAIQRIDGSKYLSFVDERGFASITASLPASALAGLDVASVSIEVGKDASLLPDEKPGEANPQLADELALATGTNRQKAETYFDQSGRDADAIRITNAMLNNLTPHSRNRSDTDGAVLNKALAQYRGAGVDPAGVALAETIHQDCVTKTDVTHHVDSMRDCLEGSHDVLVTHTNIDFWDSLGGS